MNRIHILLLSACLLLNSCSSRITDFTIISSKNINIKNIAKLKRGGSRVSGQDLKHIIIFIPLGVPNVKQAIDNAIEQTPGAVALIDGVIDHHSWYIPYLYGRSWYEVTGTPLIDKTMSVNFN